MNEETAQKLLKKVLEDYNNISEDFDKTRKNSWEEFETFIPYIKPNQKLADLGCGNGRFYKFIKKHCQISYTGIDNNSPLLQKAQESYPEAKFIKGDLLKIPLKNDSQDIAIAIASLHHIPSNKYRTKAIKEIHRILKKNGILILTVWNLFQPKYKKYIWKSRIRHLLSFGKYDSRDVFIPWGKSGVDRYYYAFKQKELEKLLEKNKFEIIKETKENNLIFICKKKSVF
jgi:ubiquinone/menaquinone biosynthesis C-methylase UbiE